MLKGVGEDNYSSYMEHIGYYFFFVACAGISIIVWVFNWICWKKQYCCFDSLHSTIKKRIVWWFSFTFLLGMLAFCIAGFITTRRFGFALLGSWCSFDRFYYDSLNGQIKPTYPKWEGLSKLSNLLTKFRNFIIDIQGFNLGYFQVLSTFFPPDTYPSISIDHTVYPNQLIYKDGTTGSDGVCNCKVVPPMIDSYIKMLNAYNTLDQNKETFLANLDRNITFFINAALDFPNFKKNFLENYYYYYAGVLRSCGRELTMAYFALLLITIFFTGTSMIVLVCLRRQNFLLKIMQVFWNIIRFFIFSFFVYGAAYGICYLVVRDSIGFIMFVFGDTNLGNSSPKLIPTNEGKEYLKFCLLYTQSDYKAQLDKKLQQSIEEFFDNYSKLKKSFQDSDVYGKLYCDYETTSKCKNHMDDIKSKIIEKMEEFPFPSRKDLHEIFERKGGLFGSFNCSFLKSDLNMVYNSLYDLSIEARVLCAFSCCIGFFGAVFVYFYLLVMHHYDNELFFDRRKSSFIGFEGFGSSKKKNRLDDPAAKKRKLNSELEIYSINEDYHAIKDDSRNQIE